MDLGKAVLSLLKAAGLKQEQIELLPGIVAKLSADIPAFIQSAGEKIESIDGGVKTWTADRADLATTLQDMVAAMREISSCLRQNRLQNEAQFDALSLEVECLKQMLKASHTLPSSPEPLKTNGNAPKTSQKSRQQ